MKVSSDNQPPARPENTNKREKRRQKACAFRTFKTRVILSPADLKTFQKEQQTKPRCLSIQIDTFEAVTGTASAMTGTEPATGNISIDSNTIAGDRNRRCRYRTGQRLSINGMNPNRNIVEERRNA